MAGKDNSTKYTAPVAVEEAGGWQASTPQQPVSEGKQDSARSEAAAKHQSGLERQSTMDSQDSQRPAYDRKAPRGMLDRSLQAQLGRQLRAIFSDIASEPVPERFVKLLEELEAKEKRR
jgi:Anti-sigma factor NepR